MEAKREGKPNEEEGRIMSSRRKTSSAKAAAASAATKPAGRQPRSKTKKPKYLSLKLQLNHKTSPKPQIPIQPTNSYNEEKRMPPPPAVKVNVNLHQQLNLFPLHPEEDTQNPKCSEDEGRRHIDDEIHAAGDDHVAILLVSDAADTSTSLHGLLDSTTTTATDEDPSSPNYSLFRGESHGFGSSTETTSYDESSSWLVRAAMRCRERDPSEERWVSYCQVVEEQKKKKKKRKHKKTNIIRLDHDEVTSGDADPLGMMLIQQQKQSSRTKLVGLKLDYQEILDAWSDRGSLYIDHDDCDPQPPPQTVPDMQDSDDLPIGIVEDSGNVWRVPEMEEGGDKETSGEGGSNKEGYCWRQREASVLRYKEKRQNRLFSKRIRYQVRKLNAEKRPRLKGRFVKRVGE